MTKSEKIKQKLLKRAEERMGIFDDWECLDEFMDAVIEEAREEKAKQEKLKKQELAKH
ncbi:MAG: hypothetical protein ACE5I5_08730 [Candidatus Heimdallarchaeota archaeon]